MDNVKKLSLAVQGTLPENEVFTEVLMDYAEKVSAAIQPLSLETAPFIVAILRNYADEVEKLHPDLKEAAEELIQALKTTVIAQQEKAPDAADQTGCQADG